MGIYIRRLPKNSETFEKFLENHELNVVITELSNGQFTATLDKKEEYKKIIVIFGEYAESFVDIEEQGRTPYEALVNLRNKLEGVFVVTKRHYFKSHEGIQFPPYLPISKETRKELNENETTT